MLPGFPSLRGSPRHSLKTAGREEGFFVLDAPPSTPRDPQRRPQVQLSLPGLLLCAQPIAPHRLALRNLSQKLSPDLQLLSGRQREMEPMGGPRKAENQTCSDPPRINTVPSRSLGKSIWWKWEVKAGLRAPVSLKTSGRLSKYYVRAFVDLRTKEATHRPGGRGS